MEKTAVIFDIQRFSLHDGPGIRTTLFLKGCPLRCKWCQNPESFKIKPETAFYFENCISCNQCINVCKQEAIKDRNLNKIDYSRCKSCGDCCKVCNSNALRVIGKKWSVKNLVLEVLKDIDFFKDSSGGVSLSGGEPMMQGVFLIDFLKELKKYKIHITIETCGEFNWKIFKKLIPYFDLIYFDIKFINTELHKKYTGKNNINILENFSKIVKSNKSILQPRMPVVPGINDFNKNIIDIAKFLSESGMNKIHCLPYHNLGYSKIKRISCDMRVLDLSSITTNDLKPVIKLFNNNNINVVTYD